MRIHWKRAVLMLCCVAALFGIFAVGANAAYTYPKMPADWQNVRVTVGDVTMPFTRYPSGSYYDPEKRYMTAAEAADYGINREVDLKGWECVGFARYTYVALFFKYPQAASVDTNLAYDYSTNYAHVNVIEQVLGTKYLSPGFSASTLKTLFTSCRPGAVVRMGGHSMVLMAIFDDGVLIYDANYSSSNEVNVRMYTWQTFVNTFGSRTMMALHMPAYYPGYSYSTGGSQDGYDVDDSTAGSYEVYNCTTLNVRTQPSTSSTSVGSLNAGTVVNVLGTYNGWARIVYNSVWRWVSMSYLRPVSKELKVTFDPAGGTASFTSRTYTVGKTFAVLPTATKTGRDFGGWALGGTVYNTSSKVPNVSALTLKARWLVCGFQDVAEDDWFAGTVETAIQRGLIARDTYFRPQNQATRSMMITVLGRTHEYQIGAELVASGNQVFDDVPINASYAAYVEWASKNGIISGVGDRSFDPDGVVTREQLASVIYRYASQIGVAVESKVKLSVLDRFLDGNQVSIFAKTAMAWCVQEGIFSGDDQNCLNPNKGASRVEMTIVFVKFTDLCVGRISNAVQVTFDPAGGTISGNKTRSYRPGVPFGELPNVTKNGLELMGWYNGNTRYTAASIVPASGVTLTARWCVKGYRDVPEGAWYASAVRRCFEYGMLVAGDYFYPDEDTGRAEVVEMLGRAYEVQHGIGSIGTPKKAPFQDVAQNATFAQYVNWAYENGIVSGYSTIEFGTDSPLTREQLAQILYRLAIFEGEVVAQTWPNQLSHFTDGGKVSEYARNAMNWAIQAKIFQGNGDSTLTPQQNVTHGQLVVLVSAYLDYAARNPNQASNVARSVAAAPETEAVAVVPPAALPPVDPQAEAAAPAADETDAGETEEPAEPEELTEPEAASLPEENE